MPNNKLQVKAIWEDCSRSEQAEQWAKQKPLDQLDVWKE